eukprot:UN4233
MRIPAREHPPIALKRQAVPPEALQPRGQFAPPPAGRIWRDLGPGLHQHQRESHVDQLVMRGEGHALDDRHREHQQSLDGLGRLDGRAYRTDEEAVSCQLRVPLKLRYGPEVHAHFE